MNKDEKLSDSEKIKLAMLLADATILLNLYAEEHIIFGRIKNGEKAPFDRYLPELGLQRIAPLLAYDIIEGRIINKGVITYDDIEKLYYEVYADKVSFIFEGAPIAKEFEEDDDAIPHFKYGLYEYLHELYKIFREVITTEITADLFATVPDIINKSELRDYNNKMTKFIRAIKMKKLRQGGCVDRYLKDVPFISPLVMRLVKKQKGRFILKNSDTDSLDYKLAFLACFPFYDENDTKLFELKLLRWEELKNAQS